MKSAQLVYQHLLDLPESVAAEVLDFVQFLESKQARASAQLPRIQGTAQGQVWIAPDFDAPLHDFRDYQ